MNDMITAMIADAAFNRDGIYETGSYTLYLDDAGFVQVYQWRGNVPVLVRDQKR